MLTGACCMLDWLIEKPIFYVHGACYGVHLRGQTELHTLHGFGQSLEAGMWTPA